MTAPILFGALLGAGVLLLLAPRLWPRSTRQRSPEPGPLRLLRDRLVQAGLASVSAPVFLLVVLLVALATTVLGAALLPVPVLGLVLGAVVLVMPFLLLASRARGRRKAGREHWPDVVDLLVSSVRAGSTLPEAIARLGDVAPEPVRPVFIRFAEDYETTGDVGRCLDDAKARLADPVADRILETLRMAREVGGTELTSVLRGLAAALRAEAAVRRELEARQGWLVNAARLGVAAPWIVLAMLVSRPAAAAAYDTPTGAAVIAGGVGVSLVAYRVMRGLGRLPEERRWFR